MKNILFFILFSVLYTQNTQAQTTSIPDTSFEAKLIQLGIDSDGSINGQILNTDAAGVHNLNVSSSNINDLTGIEAFINLTALNCTDNLLTSLIIDNNISLKELYCPDNQLTELNINNNTALIKLTFQNNQLTTINLNNNTALTHIVCYTNQLTSLNVDNNTALVTLSCFDNQLTSLNLNNNTALVTLTCLINQLTSLNINNCSDLTHLKCNNNQLTSLNLNSNTALIELDCYSNQLTSLNLNNNTSLKELHCSFNQLTSLNLNNNTNLLQLTCSTNPLHSLNLNNNNALTRLSCSNTSLISLNLSNNTALEILNCSNNSLTSLNLNSNTLLKSLFCNNNKLSTLNITKQHPGFLNMYAENNLPALRICVLNVIAANQNLRYKKDSSAYYSENCSPLAVTGKIAIDNNNNCLADSSEQGLTNQLIRFERISDSFTTQCTTYDNLGTYQMGLDTGTYNVTVIPSSSYYQVCPSSQTIVVDTNYTIQTIDWALQPIISCPMLEVDVAAPFLRRTGGGSAYTISYCNNGTIPALNAYVEVDLDTDLIFVNSTIPLTSQNGATYRFDIGNIAVGQCGAFDIQVLVDNSALFEQTHCTQVHIYPDSICIPLDTTPIIIGEVSCQNDTVFFTLENTGTSMTQTQKYDIFEDNIAMHTGAIQLGNGASQIIAQAAALGKTYRIEVQQQPDYPSILGDSLFSLVLEGCNNLPDGSFNTGFVTQFSNGLSSPFEAIDCQQNVASYDPNDKAAQPVGYGVQHYIYDNTPIDYKIRFQNTGTDTAFNIVIIDTLSPLIDIATLKMGTSSHNYTWSIEDGNVLRVNFTNIMLVDSNANEPLSHGFFRYRIEQKANNSLGSVIYNQAAIYFDYNPPIFTNTTFHTISADFVETKVSVDRIYQEVLQVKAYPNPFTYSTTIEVEGEEYEQLELEIYDLLGRKMAHKQTTFSNQIQLERGNLQTGIYIYRLIGDKQIISSGKITVD